MRKLAIGILLSMSTSAFAQSSGTISTKIEKTPVSGEEISRGIRVSVTKSLMHANLSEPVGSTAGDAKQQVGVGIGYASIRTLDVGFMGNVIYDTFKADGDNVGMARIEGNATYGLQKIGYGFLGLNVSQIISGVDSRLTKNPGIGWQFGIGANVTRLLGVDVAYVMEANKLSGPAGSADLSMTGVELRVHATF